MLLTLEGLSCSVTPFAVHGFRITHKPAPSFVHFEVMVVKGLIIRIQPEKYKLMSIHHRFDSYCVH